MNREFTDNITSMHGDAGREWLASLPEIVRELERRWSLEAGEPFPNLTYNYVVPCLRPDGTQAVMKIGFPGEPDTRREPAALAAFGGRGMVHLLDSNAEIGAMLLERIEPGNSLLPITDDEEATCILAETMVKVATPVPANHDFPHVRDWARGFDRLRKRYGGGTGPMPEGLVRKAESLFAELLASTDEEHLLHGDLHHDNVLMAGDGNWLAIDPKGVVGDSAFEPAAMLHNPAELSGKRDLHIVLETRLNIICDVTGYERQRVVGWAFAQSVLSAYWNLEDQGEVWEEPLVFARALETLMPG